MQRTRRTDILRWQMLPAPHARDWAAGPSRRGVGRLFAWLERSKMRTRMPLSFEDDRRRALRREPGGVAQRGGFATRKAVQPSKRQAQFPVRALRWVLRGFRAYVPSAAPIPPPGSSRRNYGRFPQTATGRHGKRGRQIGRCQGTVPNKNAYTESGEAWSTNRT